MYPNLRKFFNDNLYIDFQSALGYLKSELQKNLTANDKATFPKFNCELLKLIRLRDKEFYFNVDHTAGRLHTNLTNLNKELRNFITYNGLPLVAVDIANSQPLISTLLLEPKFYESGANSSFQFNLFDFYSKSHTNLFPISDIIYTIMLVKNQDSLDRQDKYDLNLYQLKASQGILYEYMEKEVTKITGFVFRGRDEIKDMMFSVLFSDNRFIGLREAEPKRIFRKLFPTVYKVFCLIKKHGKENLPILLQTIEAKLILEIVAMRISKERADIPIFTIHDSIVCTVGNEKHVAQVMVEEIQRCIGITPCLKFEPWNPLSVFNEKDKK